MYYISPEAQIKINAKVKERGKYWREFIITKHGTEIHKRNVFSLKAYDRKSLGVTSRIKEETQYKIFGWILVTHLLN